MWRIVQQDKPDDFVLATGRKHSVRAFVEAAFAEIGMAIEWSGKGVDEIGRDAKSGAIVIVIDPRYFRPTEVDLLVGDPGKALKVLGWTASTSFADMVYEMVQSDLEAITREAAYRRLDEEAGLRCRLAHEPKAVARLSPGFNRKFETSRRAV
jgi:GDPmannose 4,6-dehydratase